MHHLKVITYLLCTLILIGSAEANQLTILHINDHHSHLRADGRMSLKINGEKTRVKSGGFPVVVSTFNNLSKGKKNVLKLMLVMPSQVIYTILCSKVRQMQP